MIGLGGLYTLQSNLPNSLPSCVSNALSKLSPSFPTVTTTVTALNSCDVNSIDTTSLWHCRLGHPSAKIFDLLQSVVPTIISAIIRTLIVLSVH